MTKNSPACHSERSEESRVLIGQIMFWKAIRVYYPELTITVGILPRPKARSEWQKKRKLAREQWRKTPLVCHSERSEESRVLIGRIMFWKAIRVLLPWTRTPSRDSFSPKSSFRMTKKGNWLVSERQTKRINESTNMVV